MNLATIHIIESVFSFALLVLLTMLLKRRGVLSAGDEGLFAKLLTQVVMPVVIFFQFARNPPEARHVLPILAMLGAGAGTLFAAWAIGTLMGFSRGATGVLMMVSSFGSSALLGYPLIQYTFPNDPEALTEAILISELAVGLPVFTLCPLVAIHFGDATAGDNSIKKTMLEYFRSPIFIAVVAGLAVAQLHLPFTRPVVQPVLQAAEMINSTMAALACLILGLQIEVRSVGKLLPIVAISAVLEMGFQPLLAHLFGGLFRLGGLERQVLVLIACMPSAVLGPVFAVRYKCEGELAATVTFINIILGAVGIPLAFWLMGR